MQLKREEIEIALNAECAELRSKLAFSRCRLFISSLNNGVSQRARISRVKGGVVVSCPSDSPGLAAHAQMSQALLGLAGNCRKRQGLWVQTPPDASSLSHTAESTDGGPAAHPVRPPLAPIAQMSARFLGFGVFFLDLHFVHLQVFCVHFSLSIWPMRDGTCPSSGEIINRASRTSPAFN